jgi:hypothetical protein
LTVRVRQVGRASDPQAEMQLQELTRAVNALGSDVEGVQRTLPDVIEDIEEELDNRIPIPTEPPSAPTNLVAIPAFQMFILKWDRSVSEIVDGYIVSFSTSEDGTSWSEWEEIVLPNISVFTHTGLHSNVHYRYRVLAYNRAGRSLWSNIYVGGKPLLISFSEEVINDFDWENWLEHSEPFQNIVADVNENKQDISAIVQTASEISSTVADLVTNTSSTFQQHANMINQRVVAKDQYGNVISSAQIQVGLVDSQGYILLDASDIFVPGTMHIFDKNPGSAASGQVTINSNGVEIRGGKLSVVNPSGTVIIDGTSNMFKIRNSGYLWADQDSVSSVTFNIPSSEVNIPAFHIIYEGFEIWGTGYGNFEGDAMWPFIIDGTVGVTRNIIGALVAVTRTSSSQVRLDLRCGRDTDGIYIRYYIFKEAAF